MSWKAYLVIVLTLLLSSWRTHKGIGTNWNKDTKIGFHWGIVWAITIATIELILSYFFPL